MHSEISEDIHKQVNRILDEMQDMAKYMSKDSRPHVTNISTYLNRIRHLADQLKEQR